MANADAPELGPISPFLIVRDVQPSDAFIDTPDPDALAAELTNRGVTFSAPLADTEDGLRGFEVQDPDGYVLFFGRPNEHAR